MGNFKNGLLNGTCTITSRYDSFQGNFINDLLQGVGKATYSDGQVYFGQWKDFRYHGKGVLTHPDGTVQKGMFIEGEFKLKVDFNENDLN